MSDELREAAQRCAWEWGINPSLPVDRAVVNELIRDAARVGEAWLAEHPADGGESMDFKAGYARATADMERGIRGQDRVGDIWPDWVYEARNAIRHENERLPWLPDLLKVLGWQGGTVHQAMNAVARLVEHAKRTEAPSGQPGGGS